jgi:hypothetical protein
MVKEKVENGIVERPTVIGNFPHNSVLTVVPLTPLFTLPLNSSPAASAFLGRLFGVLGNVENGLAVESWRPTLEQFNW